MLEAIFKALGVALADAAARLDRDRRTPWRRPSFAPRTLPRRSRVRRTTRRSGSATSSSSPASSASKPGERPVEGDITAQTEQVLRNLTAILEEAGSSLANLVKTSVFLQDLGDFAAMNEVYARYVGDRPPARSTFEVARLPSGALVEIEAVAHV